LFVAGEHDHDVSTVSPPGLQGSEAGGTDAVMRGEDGLLIEPRLASPLVHTMRSGEDPSAGQVVQSHLLVVNLTEYLPPSQSPKLPVRAVGSIMEPVDLGFQSGHLLPSLPHFVIRGEGCLRFAHREEITDDAVIPPSSGALKSEHHPIVLTMDGDDDP